MATHLRDLLGAEEPLFSASVRQLERASGQTGRDVRLIADILHKAHQAMREMGLDPADTTGKELYTALLSRARRDNDRITAKIAGRDSSRVKHMTPLIVDAAKRLLPHKKTWVLKHEKACELLRNMPPRKLIKALGYADIEALLRKEDSRSLFIAIRFSEGKDWLRDFNSTVKEVTANDFEERPIEIISLDEKYTDVAKDYVATRQHPVTHSKELGVVAVLPMRQTRQLGFTLKTLPLILHYANEARMYSAYFKLARSQANFGKRVAHILNNDAKKASHLAGHEVHWRVVQQYFGAIDDSRHPESFQPHVSPEDLYWKKAEATLYSLDPALTFWKDKEYVGVLFDSVPVTTNLLDVSFALSAETPYDQHSVHHFRESLWNELFARYMGDANLEFQAIANLGASEITLE